MLIKYKKGKAEALIPPEKHRDEVAWRDIRDTTAVTECRALYTYICYNKTDGTDFYKWQLNYIRLSQFNLAFYLSTKHKTFCLFNDKESRDECFTSTIYNTDILTENKVSVHLMLGIMARDNSIFQWSTMLPGCLVMTKNNSHFLWLLIGAGQARRKT